MVAAIMEEIPIETLKEEMVAMVKEEMPFMEMIEAVSTPSKKEPKAKVEETAAEKQEPSGKEPGGSPMETAMVPSKPESGSSGSSKEKPNVIEEKNEPEKNKEEKPTSEATATSVVSKEGDTKQKKVQSKETIKPKLAKVMAKVDEKVKNPLKNLQLKNLIKMDAMVEDQLSLDVYNVAFYVPKNIYLEQLNLIDNRLIYADKTLASYTDNDIIGIKSRKLGILNYKKQQILIELETLNNEKS